MKLPLETQLYLKALEQQIKNVGAEDLRVLLIKLATQKAMQEQIYKLFLQKASIAEKDCYCRLNKVEKECQILRQEIASNQ